MKILHSIVATNSVITLADGSREVIADEALEDGARQINGGAGLPSFVEHDRQRICGWSHRAWTEREGIALKLVMETEVPETNDEWQLLLQRYSNHCAEESESRTSPYKEITTKFNRSDIELTYDKEYVLLRAPGLARNYCAAVFANMDDDGLVPITKEIVHKKGGLGFGDYFLAPSRYLRASFRLPNQINRELMNTLLRLVVTDGVEVRLSLDEDVLAIPSSFQPTHEREYWWGPKFKGDPGAQPRGMAVHGPTKSDSLNGLIRTEFWWYGKNELTFEVEELVASALPLSYGDREKGMRFVHSIIDEKVNKSRHIDGAVRLYSSEQWDDRLASKITEFGKKAVRRKLWRVDGLLEHEDWYDLVHTFYRGNYTIGEYFGFPDPKTYRATFERSLNN